MLSFRYFFFNRFMSSKFGVAHVLGPEKCSLRLRACNKAMQAGFHMAQRNTEFTAQAQRQQLKFNQEREKQLAEEKRKKEKLAERKRKRRASSLQIISWV